MIGPRVAALSTLISSQPFLSHNSIESSQTQETSSIVELTRLTPDLEFHFILFASWRRRPVFHTSPSHFQLASPTHFVSFHQASRWIRVWTVHIDVRHSPQFVPFWGLWGPRRPPQKLVSTVSHQSELVSGLFQFQDRGAALRSPDPASSSKLT